MAILYPSPLRRMEIEENLKSLPEWWDRTNASSFPPHHPMAGVQHVDAVKKLELPIWRHRVWEACVLLVPTALDEAQCGQIHCHHQNLDQLSSLKNLDNQKPSDLEARIRGGVERILEWGNPLKERAAI